MSEAIALQGDACHHITHYIVVDKKSIIGKMEDKKSIIGKMEDPGKEAQGVADPQKIKIKK
jgi:hypothetical protein